ncbi:MAG: heavy metal translocating P-type ATPase [Actinobacteria bacterium]|nr:MAG: heavy metal translocating P-type ATPase [Actinomycetota bacterium]
MATSISSAENGHLAARLSDGRQFGAPKSLKLVHSVPGRVRLRVPRVAGDNPYAARLATLIEQHEAVDAVRVSAPTASIVIRHQPLISADEIRALVERQAGAACDPTVPVPELAPRPTPANRKWLPALPAGLAFLSGPLGVPIPATMMLGGVAAGAFPIAQRAVRSLATERRLTLDVMDTTAIVLTTLQGSFAAPAMVIGLVEVGEAIRNRTARASKREAYDLLATMTEADAVWVERGAERHRVPIDEVGAGDHVIVYPGDRIPVDGRVVQGSALIDEHQLTGESMPVLRGMGQPVFASTLLREGHLHIRAERVGSDTRAGRIIGLVQDAPVHDTRVENYAAKAADRILLPSFLLSGGLLLLTRNPSVAASILITDFLTGIRVSVPTTVLASMTSAGRRGILVRSGRAMEKLAAVDTIVFDKTGTVTRGEPTITGVEAARDAMAPAEVLAMAAAANQRLRHPLAEAVVRYARERGIEPPPRRNLHYEIGLGVRASVDGLFVLVGSDRLLRLSGIDVGRFAERRPTGCESQIFVAANGELCGMMTYTDPPRPESKEVVDTLRSDHGMAIHLLSGDKRASVASIADVIGIDPADAHAELFPEDKVEIVRRLQAEGRSVAFVGDGVNDGPALAYADASVSFGGATDVARETADVVLTDDDLRGLPEAVATARQAMGIIHQNIRIITGMNVGALALALPGAIGPASAALIHNGSTIVAGANGLRPLAGRGERPVPPERGDSRRA